MLPITDLHMHVVFDVDDGARNIGESLQMLKIAESQGVTDVFCTSHNGYSIEDGEKYLANLKWLKEAAEMEGINIRYMNKITGGDPDGKFYKMMEFAGSGWKDLIAGKRNMERAGDVADPWYTGDFGVTWRDVSAGCEGLLEYLLTMEADAIN